MVAKTGPETFESIAVDFTDPVPIGVYGPLTPRSTVIHPLVDASCSPKLSVGLPLVGVDMTARRGVRHDERYESLPIGSSTDAQMERLVLSTGDPDDSRSIVVPSATTPSLVGATAWWITGVVVRNPLLAGILIHLVSFGDQIG